MKPILFCLLALCCLTSKSQVYLKATLSAAEEVPTNASPANGVAIVRYNSTTKFLEITGDYQNLTSAATASHIHSPAAVGANGPVIIPLTNTGGTTGTIKGTATLTVQQESDLMNGLMYVNVHTGNFPGGEIRGQLTTTTAGQTDYLTARIQGAQEVPPNASTAIGSAIVLSDKTTGTVYLTGSFSGLTTPASASHIHTSPANTNGGVIIPLTCTAATSGTIHISSAISSANQALMTNGGCYVNIHDATNPGGEIRGQLITESLMVYLKATLQGSQEVPPSGSSAVGTAIVTYNTSTKFLQVVGDYQNLSSTISATHIHSPATVGANAPVLIPLTHTGGTSGVISGSATLTAGQESDLMNGLMYLNVHSVNFGGGEIRGQLTTASIGQSYYMTGSFSGSQEVPSNASAGTGNVTALLDNVTRQVFVTANFSGIGANASAAHIHSGAPGTSGPVVVPLTATSATSGTVTGNAVVTTTFANSLINGQTYVNVHDPTFPGGEMRAQLGNQVLPLQLVYFNGYTQNNKVALVWESAQEFNFRQYEIEEQDQATGSWISKAIIPGRGGRTVADYTYLDVPITATSLVFYHLKMVDNDGRISFSPVIKINFKAAKTTLSVLVNPVQDNQLKYQLTGLPADKPMAISIVDYNGRTVLKSTASSLRANPINVSGLPNGMYRLLVQAEGNVMEAVFMK